MRITNNMMMNKTMSNINGNKLNVDRLNNQMSSQKKIERPSDDPIVAIRALRLRSSLSQVNQYCEKNIPDAKTWLSIADTSLYNMNKILSSVKTQCNYGTNSTLTADDRNTILENLTKLKEQLYSEGNADNAGRTIFTGFRTNSKLTFMKDESNTSYSISQKFKADSDISEFKYYSGGVDVPTTTGDIQATGNIKDTAESNCNRIRMGYDNMEDVNKFSYSYGATTVTFDKAGATTNADGSLTYYAVDQGGAPVNDPSGTQITMTVYENEDAWSAADANGVKKVGDNSFVFIKSKGDLVIGKDISESLKSNHADMNVDYDKTGFNNGELRPEYYYNCIDKTDPANPVAYEKYDANGKEIYQDIKITISANQTLTVNLQASDIFDMSIYQDVVEMTDAVQAAIKAHDKVTKIESMMKETQYADYESQLKEWLDAANKEVSYADQNVTNLFSSGIGNFDGYMQDVNKAYTEVGTRGDQLEMTESRVTSQQLTTETLKSTNEDRDLSDIIIDYTAAYTAYQASLQASSKLEKQTLLDYI